MSDSCHQYDPVSDGKSQTCQNPKACAGLAPGHHRHGMLGFVALYAVIMHEVGVALLWISLLRIECAMAFLRQISSMYSAVSGHYFLHASG